jgi:hypothetical protein
LARDDATPGAVFYARAEAFRTEARRLTSRFNRFANLRLRSDRPPTCAYQPAPDRTGEAPPWLRYVLAVKTATAG